MMSARSFLRALFFGMRSNASAVVCTWHIAMPVENSYIEARTFVDVNRYDPPATGSGLLVSVPLHCQPCLWSQT